MINQRDDNPIYIMTDTVSHTEMNDICENLQNNMQFTPVRKIHLVA